MQINDRKYVWSQRDGGEMHGLFDTLEEATNDARNYAKIWETSMSIYIFDARPATENDAHYFQGEDAETEEVINFTPNWFEGRYVPENVVEKLFVG